MFNTLNYGFRAEVVPVWNGEEFEIRDVYTVSTTITNEIYMPMPPEHPEYNMYIGHLKPHFGIAAMYDPVRSTILYTALQTVLRPGGDDNYLQMELAEQTHRLYDVAQRVDRNRRAIKDAFAKCVEDVLCDDLIWYIFRFC